MLDKLREAVKLVIVAAYDAGDVPVLDTRGNFRLKYLKSHGVPADGTPRISAGEIGKVPNPDARLVAPENWLGLTTARGSADTT